MKEDEIGGECGMYGEEEKFMQGFGAETQRQEPAQRT
jgi:hypothetical protein